MTGCDFCFLLAVCGVRGAVLRVACVRVCACSDCGCAGRRTGMQDLCVRTLRVSVRCVVRGLLACAVLGDTRHDAHVPLCWMGLIVSCVSAHSCAWCGRSGNGALRCALGLRQCKESRLRHTRDVHNARLGRALPAALLRAQ